MAESETANVLLRGIPVRLDATLCAPGEVWIEGPNGEAVRVRPEREKDDQQARTREKP